jgi:hypothetical protein
MSDGQVFAEERQRRIAAYVAGRGRDTGSRAGEADRVASATLRKDLSALEGRGLVRDQRTVTRGPRRPQLGGQGAMAKACLELIEDGRVALSTTDLISSLPMELTGTSRGDELTLNLKVAGRQMRAETSTESGRPRSRNADPRVELVRHRFLLGFSVELPRLT